ncbi:TetR/AcrR family transcriptional regulator [Nocardioides limicola]|uniref:TetR/AcrR family transcriptional regulator n=1 Tax=Nocardioides limicola TaxID=2803368 RepID=UPI00193B3A33|nr:TetR/AcrR family transcriptional regulator [Nocardioides sp. DJM-14]
MMVKGAGMNAVRPKGEDGRRVRWEQHNQQRRQAVIDAAVAVIEAHPPGHEIHVQQIADRAGINRSVVYRHFTDRSDLDLAVQDEVCLRAATVVLEAITLDGTPREITHRVVDAYIRWAVAHAALVQFAERHIPGADRRPLDDTLQQIVEQVEVVIGAFVPIVGGRLSQFDRDALDPWVFGLIGGCFGAVRRWSSREELSPDVDSFVDLVTDMAWFQIEGMARSRGLVLPEGPVQEWIGDVGALAGETG